jgi:hypothetical protein
VTLQGQLAGDRDVVAGAADVPRLEAELRMALCVEELGALEAGRQIRVVDLHARDLGRSA